MPISLFDPVLLGEYQLANRIVLAPMTRSRANEQEVQGPLAPLYYSQRASAGLIIAEATQISDEAQGYPATPGIYTDAQIQAWRDVTDAVHAKGGRIFLQLWHTGRVSHTSFQPDGKAPVAPSAIAAEGVYTFILGQGKTPVSVPRALTLPEIAKVVQDFAQAAENAIRAGFDGVEVHGANGYLLDQFLRDNANHRDDQYGGSLENRSRLLLEVVHAVAERIGAQRTGVRLSPVSPYNGLQDSNPQAIFEYVVKALDASGIAYVHVIEGATGGKRDYALFDYAALKKQFSRLWIANNGYSRETAIAAIEANHADLISFARPFIFNPDLVRRFKENAALNTPFEDISIYGGKDAHGYTDYPEL